MLDKETIKSLWLIPEVDMAKVKQLQFNNSDKQSKEVMLGNNPEASRTAYFAAKTATRDRSGQ